MNEITEYRGIEGLVYAEVTKDNNDSGTGEGYVTGTVKPLAGVAELSRTTESSSEPHYYDNIPAIVINSTGSDEVTINCSAIPFDVLADITGQVYDNATGAFIEGERTPKYFALGYKTKKTNGDEVYVWRLKGQFSIPDSTHATEDDGTDANGQEITYTGISTTHKFTKTGKGAKALNVDVAKGLADVTTFFSTVTTPDTLQVKTKYDLAITSASGTTVTVTRNGQTVTAGTGKLSAGDVITVTCTGGTMTLNGSPFTSGQTHTVAANVTIASTAQG